MGVVLIGLRGSGKTTVGRRLAAVLGWPFVDADEEVTRRAGRTVAEIFRADGEPAFRDLEAAVVRDLAGRPGHVLSVGGGAVLRADTRAALAGHSVVYLRADPETLHRRTSADPATAATRPRLTPLSGPGEVRALHAVREPIYRAVCTHEVDATDQPPEVIATTIARLLTSTPGVSAGG